MSRIVPPPYQKDWARHLLSFGPINQTSMEVGISKIDSTLAPLPVNRGPNVRDIVSFAFLVIPVPRGHYRIAPLKAHTPSAKAGKTVLAGHHFSLFEDRRANSVLLSVEPILAHQPSA